MVTRVMDMDMDMVLKSTEPLTERCLDRLFSSQTIDENIRQCELRQAYIDKLIKELVVGEE